jgi:hypothetical protein
MLLTYIKICPMYLHLFTVAELGSIWQLRTLLGICAFIYPFDTFIWPVCLTRDTLNIWEIYCSLHSKCWCSKSLLNCPVESSSSESWWYLFIVQKWPVLASSRHGLVMPREEEVVFFYVFYFALIICWSVVWLHFLHQTCLPIVTVATQVIVKYL